MRVAVIQHDIAWEDPEATFARVGPRIAAAAAAEARLVVLAEMFSTGFSMDAEAMAEAIDGPSTSFLVDQAAANGLWVTGSVPLRGQDGAKPTNTLVLAGPEGTVARYDKTHPFSYAGEHEHYRAGDTVVTIDVEGLRVTPFICYDLRFADAFWMAAPDTDCYVVVANWPSPRRRHWSALLRARAIENQAYVVAANRVGEGGGLSYSGDSAIIDPLGEELAAAAGGEALLVAEVDAEVVRATRERFGFIGDRRGGSLRREPG